MAEVIASIIGISSFGIKLTDTLYQFGSTFSAARDQTIRTSERITDYTTILDILSTTIEDEADFVSDQAVVMIQRLCDQSVDLFYDIEDHLPTRRDLHGQDSIIFRDKLLWTFRTKNLTEFRRREQKSKVKTETKSEELQRQELKARNAIVQHMNAGERLEKLKVEAARADDAAIASAESSSALIKSSTNTAIAMISHQAEAITRFQEAMLRINDPARRQAFVVGNSSVLLEDLLMQWTTFDVTDKKPENSKDNGRATGSGTTAMHRNSARLTKIKAELVRGAAAAFRARARALEGLEKVTGNDSSASVFSESEPTTKKRVEINDSGKTDQRQGFTSYRIGDKGEQSDGSAVEALPRSPATYYDGPPPASTYDGDADQYVDYAPQFGTTPRKPSRKDTTKHGSSDSDPADWHSPPGWITFPSGTTSEFLTPNGDYYTVDVDGQKYGIPKDNFPDGIDDEMMRLVRDYITSHRHRFKPSVTEL
ncbi:MAG: hypothetical protein Q9160_007137 [Pyrenula sp. 1 TL-2023]